MVNILLASSNSTKTLRLQAGLALESNYDVGLMTQNLSCKSSLAAFCHLRHQEESVLGVEVMLDGAGLSRQHHALWKIIMIMVRTPVGTL